MFDWTWAGPSGVASLIRRRRKSSKQVLRLVEREARSYLLFENSEESLPIF